MFGLVLVLLVVRYLDWAWAFFFFSSQIGFPRTQDSIYVHWFLIERELLGGICDGEGSRTGQKNELSKDVASAGVSLSLVPWKALECERHHRLISPWSKRSDLDFQLSVSHWLQATPKKGITSQALFGSPFQKAAVVLRRSGQPSAPGKGGLVGHQQCLLHVL